MEKYLRISRTCSQTAKSEADDLYQLPFEELVLARDK
jgi:hypothetical protein